MANTEHADPAAPILEPVETVTLPAETEPFAIRERFERSGPVRFSTVWNEFKRRFYGLTEPAAPETRLRKFRLTRIAPDGPIIEELGGEERAQSRVGAAFALIRAQARGEDGVLQTNGFANIFYARDLKGELCAVRIGWDEEGWVVDAIAADDPLAWNGKHQIFSPAPG